MELKSPKAKKKTASRLTTWSKIFRTPLLILFLLGTSSGDNELSLSLETSMSNATFQVSRHRHNHMQPSFKDNIVNDIKYFRRQLNRREVNFVMTDVLMDGEVENRVHYNGITAKETYVGSYSNGLRLRQLTDGRHLVQVIYTQNGDIQDCEYLSDKKSTRNFLKTLRKELKQALDEELQKNIQKETNDTADEKFYRHFGNVTFWILKDDERLPRDIESWLDYKKLRMKCLKRHEELKYMVENNNKVGEVALTRFRACLKLADTSVSNMVGKLFFNVVQSKCFVLKPVKVCVRRSWWGRCLRRGYAKQAFLRDNLPY